MTIQVFAKALNAMMRIPFCSTLLNWHSFRMDLLIIGFFFFFLNFRKRTCSFSLLFLFACRGDLFVFLPFCFSCFFFYFLFFFFFARYIDCVHDRSMWVFFFFFKRKAMCMAMFFLGNAFSHQFSWGHGQGV